MTKQEIELIPLKGFPIVNPGDDISQLLLSLISDSDIEIAEGDIFVVSHSIVSVAERSFYTLDSLDISERARQIASDIGESPERVEIALREASTVIKEQPVLITKTPHGIITDFSGIDESNAPANSIIVLPKNPDNSARTIHRELSEHLGFNLPVIISDTQGRPWRKGAVNLAIGVAGMSPFTRNVGKEDIYGHELRGSLVCLVDQVASAAELVMGQADEGVPVVVVRGIDYDIEDGLASQILRSDSENLFN